MSSLPTYSAQDRHIDDLRAAHTAWSAAESEARRSGIWGPANDARGKFRRLQGRPKADPAPLHVDCGGRVLFFDALGGAVSGSDDRAGIANSPVSPRCSGEAVCDDCHLIKAAYLMRGTTCVDCI